MTDEQYEVINHVKQNNGFTKVLAMAGTGKSFTSIELCKELKPKDGFYTAFNKAIVNDSAYKLKGLIEAKTIHSLAYKYINPSKVQELTYNDIKENISYQDKTDIIKYLDKFFRSSYLDLEEFLQIECDNEFVHNYIIDYAHKMYTRKIPCTFNFLLKCLHKLLYDKSLNITKDLVIVDELQDVSSVMLEIVKLIDCDKKVMLGDTYQNIYSFLDTVNGFDLIEEGTTFKLTKSFRCCIDVAEQVENYGKLFLNEDFKYTGNKLVSNKIDDNSSKVYLSKTNSKLIFLMYNLLKQNKSFSLVRSVDEIFALPISIIMASSGKPVYDFKYKFLETEYNKWKKNKLGSFIFYLSTLGIDEVTSAINVLQKLNKDKINIFDLKTKIKNLKPNHDCVLSTAHAFKGLEKNIAIIDTDLENDVLLNCEDKQALNLYYVALSRAQNMIKKGF